MGVMLYDTTCMQRLLLKEGSLDEFKTLTDSMYGPLDWRAGDSRISATDGGLLAVKPLDRCGYSFLSGSKSDFYDEHIGLMLTLCEPGSIVEVLDGETGLFQQFSIGDDGNLTQREARLVNPFDIGRPPREPTRSAGAQGPAS